VARPGSTRNSAGRFTHLGIRAHMNPKGDGPMAEVIATETKIVHDPVLDIDRQVIAGQPVPPDLVDAYKAAGGDAAPDASEAIQQPAADQQPELTGDELKERAAELDIKGRSAMNADELRAAIAQAEAEQA
jgi:hypothetical protein